MAAETSVDSQLNIFTAGISGSVWPQHDRFPYNLDNNQVKAVVWNDLLESADPLIIAGYASLDQIIDFLATYRARWGNNFSRIRVLLGHEPYESHRLTFGMQDHGLPEEVANYWLERGISLLLSAKVVAVLDLLKSDSVQIQTSNRSPIHAKIYKGDNAITIGSSNFSTIGMTSQVEGNCRFTRESELDRFTEACTLAEAIWNMGGDYKTSFTQLLESLLQVVTWQEALARACAEILEGDWANQYITANATTDDQPLWPVQQVGIAQAMWILENVGSVLVADATGSGKTRLGAHLIRALQVRNLRTGRIRNGTPVLVCPPYVARNWERETDGAVKTYSHGILSRKLSGFHQDTIDAIRRAQVLAVDEAHNFLNRISARTRVLYANMADHVLLFTATPINRGPQDLIAIIDLLGADNFDDHVIKVVEKIWRRRRRNRRDVLSSQDRAIISSAIQRFTVRRTKHMLNEAINAEPDKYKNISGAPCRYPKHLTKTYDCGATQRDRDIAREIRDLATRLRGITYLRSTLHMPEYLRIDNNWDDAKYLEIRLRAAKALAAYRIADTLRSSRAALIEHIYGTQRAMEACGISETVKSSSTGDMIGKLRQIRGKVPPNKLDTELPEWLSDPESHARACDEELEVYEKIGELAHRLSGEREEAKARLLTELMDQHGLVLAFDSHLITLSDISKRLEGIERARVLIATGQSKATREEVNRLFGIQSEAKNIIALCSDALSEGINLQGASVVVFLDVPSVIRVAEQRIGRVDRMDSPHDAIEVYWPVDSEEFALRTDERLVERHRDVEDLIGANIHLPDHLVARSRPEQAGVVDVQEYAAEVERLSSEEQFRYGIQIYDAFEPVRALVSGDDPLIPPDYYKAIKDKDARVLCSVSAIDAPSNWAFYAIRRDKQGTPQWIYFDDQTTDPITDLELVSTLLRAKLSGDIVNRKVDEAVTERIVKDIDQLERSARKLLPRNKRRAISEMLHILEKYKNSANKADDYRRMRVLRSINRLFTSNNTHSAVDYNIVADWWLDTIRPYWHKHLINRKRFRPALLKDIRRDLLLNPIPTEELETLWDLPIHLKPVSERIAAAIIGVNG